MIVAPQPVAVEAGAKVLMSGGNAIDAAVTCAFVQSTLDPQSCGLGGFFLLNLHLAQAPQNPVLLDGPAVAGEKATPTMWQDIYLRPSADGWGYLLQGDVNDIGYQAICTPGTVKALGAMLERWGTISWERAIAPAIQIAEEGFVVGQQMSDGWKIRGAYTERTSAMEYIRRNPEASRIYLHADSSPYDAGELLRNPDLARTLRQLAEKGADDFYQGELARRISADLAANGSFITPRDLATYRLRETESIVTTYHGYTIATCPPPHGGPVLLEMLNILEGYDLAALGHNSPEYIYLASMAMKSAFADRNPYLADPEFSAVPVEWMTSKSRAAQWRDRIDRGEPIKVSTIPVDSPDTTHISVVDHQGNCVSLTHSLGASSGVISPGLGFMYNNSMALFHPLPGHPNSIAPGKGRITNMTPTIIYKDGQPALIIGAPGGNRIMGSLAQVIVNFIDFGMGIQDAILAPRFACEGDIILCQPRIPEYICAQVRPKHPIRRLAQSYSGLAMVHAIAIDPVTGKLSGGADPAGAGMPLQIA